MADLMLVNPRRRRTTAARKRRPYTRRRTTYKRNPTARRGGMKLGNLFGDAIMPAATAAGGALALDMVMGFLPLPANLKTGPMRYLVKGAGAIGMGMLAGTFVKPETAKRFTTGALTVLMYDAGKNALGTAMPQLNLGYYENDTMGYYENNDMLGLGYYEEGDEMEGMGYYGAGYNVGNEGMMGTGQLSVEEELEL